MNTVFPKNFAFAINILKFSNQDYWNRKTEKCEPIKCPDGYVGDFQPNCSFKPKCPAEFPGNLFSQFLPCNQNSNLSFVFCFSKR